MVDKPGPSLSPADPDGTCAPLPSDQVGDTIGPYHLLQKVGEGGMGEVWVAEQHEPIRRTVALKVIKLGMDTRQVMTRFEAERQALALMDHPAIAKVFDAGATALGRPFFVMEYVKGEAITAYCDRRRLSTPERLMLFMRVCDGVQHAHQKGIIHRDLKPSNVLVTEVDGQAVPKIIDFGVAKATAHQLTAQTVFTELGVLIGTPEYMSPEQAELTGLDVDTRTDVYSLGVMLYELLVGALPFDPIGLRQAGLDAIRRQIREVDPPRPSTRVSMFGEGTAAVARTRQTDPSRLVGELRGDLDSITMKCLEKDRTRRYGSASSLAEDLQRHLSHQPVLAGPPSATYRARKFVRRHRASVLASALVLLALVGGIAGTTVGLLRAMASERKATVEAEAARQVSDFLVGLFQVSDPNEAKGNTITAREILDRGAERIGRDLRDQPIVQRRLMHTMGRVYENLGLYGTSAELMERALAIARLMPERREADLAGMALELAWLYKRQGKLDQRARAIELCREGLDLRRAEYGEVHYETARAVRLLGILLRDKGEYGEARRLLEESVTLFEKTGGPNDPELAGALYHLGWLLKLTGDSRAARPIYERAARVFEATLGTDNTQFAWCLSDLSVVNENLGDFDAARQLQERALAISTKLLGPEHPDVGAMLGNLGVIFWRMRDFGQAASVCERALTIQERALGPDHPTVVETLGCLELSYEAQGDHARARTYNERAVALRATISGPKRP